MTRGLKDCIVEAIALVHPFPSNPAKAELLEYPLEAILGGPWLDLEGDHLPAIPFILFTARFKVFDIPDPHQYMFF